MLKKCRTSFIAVLLCLIMVMAQILPGIKGTVIVKAEEKNGITIKENSEAAQVEKETEFKGASGISGDLKWNITAEGHLTVEGEGDYNNVKITYDNNSNTDYYINKFDYINYGLLKSINAPEWLKYHKYIYTAEINVKNIKSTKYMFTNCTNLTNLDLDNLDTNNITDMSYMFYGCYNLYNINLNKFNTSNVTNMCGMFSDCSFTNLDLSKFNTTKVTNMGGMFNGCGNLKNLNLDSFNTSNVVNMDSMFKGCFNLTNLDLNRFNTINVTNMSHMFEECSSLTSLDLKKFNTNNVIYMDYIFYGCSSLTNLDIKSFNTRNVISMFGIFRDCSSLTSLDLSNFDTSNVKEMFGVFYGCSSLTNLDLSNFNTSNVKDMEHMFDDCNNLKTLDISSFDTSNIVYRNEEIDGTFYYSGSFSLSGLESLEKLYFPANVPKRYYLPSFMDYHWEDENGIHRAKTVRKSPVKMTYTKVKGSYVPSADDEDDDGNDINTGIYADSSCTSLAAVSVRTHFVNGGNVKQTNNTKVNYKTKTYYTNLQASDIKTVNSKGKTKIKKGKLIACITSTENVPSIVNGKVSKDVSASKIAKASINKGRVKVTAQKQPGDVYLWVMDTGDARASVCTRIVVNAAPSKVQVFAKPISDKDFSSDKKNVYKKDLIDIGNCVKLYVYPSYKQNGQFVETKDASYSASVNDKAADYFTVAQDKDNPYCFIVTAKALKNNKKTAGKITIKCNENGKKAVFTATAINSVQDISLGSLNGITENAVSGGAVSSYTITSNGTDKQTGSFVISTDKSSSNFETTDKVKLYAMGSADGFDKSIMDKGRVKVISKPDADQKKLKAKLGSDKKTVTITSAKKTPAGTSVYYLIFYNNQKDKGYKIIKITSATAETDKK